MNLCIINTVNFFDWYRQCMNSILWFSGICYISRVDSVASSMISLISLIQRNVIFIYQNDNRNFIMLIKKVCQQFQTALEIYRFIQFPFYQPNELYFIILR